ncbi:MAG: stage V sporulation protein AE [Eubacterium sp.]|nr:stage V sporulation protein AE [Eubacterium sp.]
MIFLYAFLVGGLICVVGQLLIDLTKMTPARILVLFVCLGVLLGAFGWYDKLVDLAGAGATIPLTGFGNALAKGVKEAIQKDGFIGIITGGFTACAGGVTVAMLSGLIVSMIAKPKDK